MYNKVLSIYCKFYKTLLNLSFKIRKLGFTVPLILFIIIGILFTQNYFQYNNSVNSISEISVISPEPSVNYHDSYGYNEPPSPTPPPVQILNPSISQKDFEEKIKQISNTIKESVYSYETVEDRTEDKNTAFSKLIVTDLSNGEEKILLQDSIVAGPEDHVYPFSYVPIEVKISNRLYVIENGREYIKLKEYSLDNLNLLSATNLEDISSNPSFFLSPETTVSPSSTVAVTTSGFRDGEGSDYYIVDLNKKQLFHLPYTLNYFTYKKIVGWWNDEIVLKENDIYYLGSSTREHSLYKLSF